MLTQRSVGTQTTTLQTAKKTLYAMFETVVFLAILVAFAEAFTPSSNSPFSPRASYPLCADIVDTAVGAGDFQTLATALRSAGLVDTLKGPGPFTVFAPTDEAFKKLPSGTVESLLKDKDKLTEILTYHVASGNIPSSEVGKLSKVETVSGKSAEIIVGNKGQADQYVKVGDAKVQTPDIFCDNGVIHIVDSVMMPQEAKISKQSSQTFDATTQAGVSAPFGFFDPLDLCPKDEKNFRKYRESELKHGRIAMLAFVGCFFGESGLNFFGSGDPANPVINGPAIFQYQEAEQVLGSYGSWTANVVGLILAVEGYNIVKGWEPYYETFGDSVGVAGLRKDYVNGDLGFDPLGLKPAKSEDLKVVQTKELNNGRLAMIGIAGFVVQELQTQESIFGPN